MSVSPSQIKDLISTKFGRYDAAVDIGFTQHESYEAFHIGKRDPSLSKRPSVAGPVLISPEKKRKSRSDIVFRSERAKKAPTIIERKRSQSGGDSKIRNNFHEFGNELAKLNLESPKQTSETVEKTNGALTFDLPGNLNSEPGCSEAKPDGRKGADDFAGLDSSGKNDSPEIVFGSPVIQKARRIPDFFAKSKSRDSMNISQFTQSQLPLPGGFEVSSDHCPVCLAKPETSGRSLANFGQIENSKIDQSADWLSELGEISGERAVRLKCSLQELSTQRTLFAYNIGQSVQKRVLPLCKLTLVPESSHTEGDFVKILGTISQTNLVQLEGKWDKAYVIWQKAEIKMDQLEKAISDKRVLKFYKSVPVLVNEAFDYPVVVCPPFWSF